MENDKFTKEERHLIYKKALKVIDKQLFLCSALFYAIKKTHGIEIAIYYSPYGNLDRFPEILKHKPKKESLTDPWWPLSNEKIRIKVLEQAIEETR